MWTIHWTDNNNNISQCFTAALKRHSIQNRPFQYETQTVDVTGDSEKFVVGFKSLTKDSNSDTVVKKY